MGLPLAQGIIPVSHLHDIYMGPTQPLSQLHSNTQINPTKTSTQDHL